MFALANTGVTLSRDVWSGHAQLMAAIMTGLVVGKPLGLVAASLLAVRHRFADKPEEYSWIQVIGAGALAGIGFTMAVFMTLGMLPFVKGDVVGFAWATGVTRETARQ